MTPAPPPNNVPDGFMHCDVIHLTDFGGIQIPTSAEELLKSLTPTFNTFTMDEAFAILSNFDFAAYPLLAAIIFGMIGLDIFTIVALGIWRGHRKKQKRKREGELFEEEAILEEIKELRKSQFQQKGTRWSRTRVEIMEKGPAHIVDLALQGASQTYAKMSRSSCRVAKHAGWASAVGAVRVANKVSAPVKTEASRCLKRMATTRLPTDGSMPARGGLMRSATSVFRREANTSTIAMKHQSTMEAENANEGPDMALQITDTTAVEAIPTREEMLRIMDLAEAAEAEKERREARATLAARSVRHMLVQSGGEDRTIQERMVRRKPGAASGKRPTPSLKTAASSVILADVLAQTPPSHRESPAPPPGMLPSNPGFTGTTEAMLMAARLRIRAQQERAAGGGSTIQERIVAGGLLNRRSQLGLQPRSSARIAPNPSRGTAQFAGVVPGMDATTVTELPVSPPLSPPSSQQVLSSPSAKGIAAAWDVGRRPTSLPPSALVSRDAGKRPGSLPPSALASQRHVATPEAVATAKKPQIRSLAVAKAVLVQSRELVAQKGIAYDAAESRRLSLASPPPRSTAVPLNTRQLSIRSTTSSAPPPPPPPPPPLPPGGFPGMRRLGHAQATASSSAPPWGSSPTAGLASARIFPHGAPAPAEDEVDLDDDLTAQIANDGKLVSCGAATDEDADANEAAQTGSEASDGTDENKDGEESRPRRNPVRFLKEMPLTVRTSLYNLKEDTLAWRPPSVSRVRDNFKEFFVNFLQGFRSDHTLVSFIAPADDDEALNEMQIVHLFWFVLMVDLLINCLQYGGLSDPSSYSPQDPLNDIINSFMGALLVVIAVMLGRGVFRWGNNRKIPEGPGLLMKLGLLLYRPIRPVAKLVYKLLEKYGVIEKIEKKRKERNDRLNRAKAAKYAKPVKPSLIANLQKRRGPSASGGQKLRAAQGQVVALAGPRQQPRPATTPPPSPPPDELPELPDASEPGSCALVVRADDEPSLITPPTPVSDESIAPTEPGLPPVKDGLRTGESLDSVAARKSKWATNRAVTKVMWKLSETSAAQRMKRPIISVGSVVKRASTAERIPLGRRFALAVGTNPEVAAKFKEQRMRSSRVYFCRQAIAWAINWIAYAFCTLLVIIYSGLFGPDATFDLLMSWLMGLTFAMGIIEPFNIFMVAAIPAFFSEESCCFRCYNKCFEFYAEVWG